MNFRTTVFALLFFSATPLFADIVVLSPHVDGDILDANGDLVFESLDGAGISMSVRNFPNNVIERAVMEFNIASIPVNATINSVTLSIGNQGIANAPLSIGFRGYTGDGVLAIPDATIASTLLATEPWTTLETRVIDLGSSFLQSQLGNTNFLGIRMQDAAANANIQFSTKESPFTDRRPVLTVDFAVPEPGSLGFLALCSLLHLRRRTRRGL